MKDTTVIQEHEAQFLAVGYIDNTPIASVKYGDSIGLYQRNTSGLYEEWKRFHADFPGKLTMPEIITNCEKVDRIIEQTWNEAEEKSAYFTVYVHNPKKTPYDDRLLKHLSDGTPLDIVHLWRNPAGKLMLMVCPTYFRDKSLDSRADAEFGVLLNQVRLNP